MDLSQQLISTLPTDLPITIIVTLLIISIFKTQLFSLIEGFKNHLTNKSNSDLDIEKAAIRHKIETEEYKQLRSGYIEEQLLEIIGDKENFERELFKDLSKAIENNTAALNAVRETSSEIIKTLEKLSEAFYRGRNSNSVN